MKFIPQWWDGITQVWTRCPMRWLLSAMHESRCHGAYEISIDFDWFPDWSGFQDTWKLIRRSFIISTTSWVPHLWPFWNVLISFLQGIHPKGQTPTGIPLDRGTGAGGACTRPGPFKLRNPRSKIIKRTISMHIIQHHPTSSRNVLVPTWFYILMYILSDERFKGNLFMKYWLDKTEPGGQLSSPAPRLLSSPIVRPSWDANSLEILETSWNKCFKFQQTSD